MGQSSLLKNFNSFVLSLRSKRFRRAFRLLEAFFAFWLRKNWGERNTDGSSGEGRGGEKRKCLPANPMILKNAPLTLSQLDKFTV